MMVNLNSTRTSKVFFSGYVQHQFQFQHTAGVSIIIFLTNLLPTTTDVLFGPLLRVILESICFLYVVMIINSKNIKDVIGLEWNKGSIDSIPWWKYLKIPYKKKFSTMVSELGSDFVFGLQDPVPLYHDNGDLWVESFFW